MQYTFRKVQAPASITAAMVLSRRVDEPMTGDIEVRVRFLQRGITLARSGAGRQHKRRIGLGFSHAGWFLGGARLGRGRKRRKLFLTF